MTGSFRLAAHHIVSAGAVTMPVIHDTRMGNGVDSNGHAALPLRAGAFRFFVNSSTGSDAHTSTQAQDPTTPLATAAKALTYCLSGRGDQVCMAQGTSYAAGLPFCGAMSGFSPLYPFAIQSYDPADPFNEAKHGAAYNGTRPVINTGATVGQVFIQGGSPSPAYIAIRGLDINPGNLDQASIGCIANATGALKYMLIENNIFRYTFLNMNQAVNDGSGTVGKCYILRGNAFYGQWSSNGGVHTGGLFCNNCSSWTLEYNVWYHCGWKIGAARTDPTASGGAVVFNHPFYMQDGTDGIERGNIIVEGSNDGGSVRGAGLIYSNLTINNPTAMLAGGGTNYNVSQPNGVNVITTLNAALGSVHVSTSGTAAAWGYATNNGKLGSTICYNIAAHSNFTSVASTLMNGDIFNQPSHCDFHHNVTYLWADSGRTVLSPSTQPFPAQIFSTFESNIWDDPASGSNINWSAVTLPNSYDVDPLLIALGYSGADAATRYGNFTSDIINYPEKRVIRNAMPLLWAGYNIPYTDTTPAVLSSQSAVATGQTTATLSFSTNKGNGLAPWLVCSAASAPEFGEVWAADNNDTSLHVVKSGSVNVTASGAQTASVTGLTAGTTYWAYAAQVDDFANITAPVLLGSFTTSP